MDWSQWAYLSALILAGLHGAPAGMFAVMVANFGATLLFSASPLAVGVADMACACAMLFMGRRGMVVAALFALMQPVYVFGAAWELPRWAIYGIVDALAYTQVLIVAGGGGGGTPRRLGASRLRFSGAVDRLGSWGHAAVGLVLNAKDGRGR